MEIAGLACSSSKCLSEISEGFVSSITLCFLNGVCVCVSHSGDIMKLLWHCDPVVWIGVHSFSHRTSGVLAALSAFFFSSFFFLSWSLCQSSGALAEISDVTSTFYSTLHRLHMLFLISRGWKVGPPRAKLEALWYRIASFWKRSTRRYGVNET